MKDQSHKALFQAAIQRATEVPDGTRNLRCVEQLPPSQPANVSAFPTQKVNKGYVRELDSSVAGDCPSSEVLGQWGFGFSGGLGSSGVDI